MIKERHQNHTSPRSRRLHIGFVPLTDCAPLVMAEELGFYRKYGLDVRLHRELGWATIRDKIIYGELDAAHAVVGLPFAATQGLGSVRCDCVTALVLNLHGNGITISNRLERASSLGADLRTGILEESKQRTLTFGIVSPVSSHHFLLRKWLAGAGLDLNRDVRIVVVPPPQMVANLKSGNLDGCCVGEPWNSVAVQSRAGICAAVSAELDFGHPEKVLMVRQDFAKNREEEHLALVAALLDACEYCDNRENHGRLMEVLSRPHYVGVCEDSLRYGITGHFDFGAGKVRIVDDFNVFHRYDANEPSDDKAAWVIRRLQDSAVCPDPNQFSIALGRQVFRSDLFQKAVQLRHSTAPKKTNERIEHQLFPV